MSQDPHTLLTTVTQQFEHWRHTRKSPRAHTPPQLQQLAVQLAEVISTGKTVAALKINHGMLRRWQKIHAINAPEPVAFVALPTTSEQPSSMTEVSSNQLTLTYPNGVVLTVSDAFPVETLSQLINMATVSGELV